MSTSLRRRSETGCRSTYATNGPVTFLYIGADGCSLVIGIMSSITVLAGLKDLPLSLAEDPGTFWIQLQDCGRADQEATRFFSYGFLRLLIQDDEVCRPAVGFLRILILGCPGYALFECGKRFLRAQGHFSPGLYTFLVSIPVHICLTWLLVVFFKLGIQGAAISLSVKRNPLPLGLAIYAWLFTNGEYWRDIDRKVLQNWSPMVRLALPALTLVAAESVGFEILVVLAGRNDNA